MDDITRALEEQLGLSPAFARLLTGRGFRSVAAVRAFLTPSLRRDWLDPLLVPGMQAGIARLLGALRAKEHICVFGDFDLDGITATAIMTSGLREAGARKVDWALPRRDEGYGLSPATVARLIELHPDLLVTVDNGVAAAEEIAHLHAAGIDVVVTDHHEPGDALPANIPVINPRLDPAYGVPSVWEGPGDAPVVELSGAGVALKVIQALGAAVGMPELWRNWLDLAAVGTIADVMVLISENRALVAAGLEQLRVRPNPGLAALASTLKTANLSSVTAERVSFLLAPRLNAAGRIDSPDTALELLLEHDPHRALLLAGRLNEMNQQRQTIERELDNAVTARAQRSLSGGRSIVLAGESWHEGVRGIVASRIARRFGVVAVIGTIDGDTITASARSIGDVDLFRVLNDMPPLLDRFGGHAGAAGLTLATQDWDTFAIAFEAQLQALPPAQFLRKDSAELQLRLSELSWQLAEETEKLEPFGHGNLRPLWSATDVEVTDTRLVGKDANHLTFTALQDQRSIRAIWYRTPDAASWIGHDTLAELNFRLEKDSYRGKHGIQLNICGAHKLGDAFLRNLYEHASETFQRHDYEGIVDAPGFYTKLAGVTFEGRQHHLAALPADAPLELERQANNPADANAIAVRRADGGHQLGFLNRDLAAQLAPRMDDGTVWTVEVGQVTGGEDGAHFGLNVYLQRPDLLPDRVSDGGIGPSPENAAGDAYRADRSGETLAGGARRHFLASLDAAALDHALKQTFIADAPLHQAQVAALDALAQGHNTLCVMATGRGKSLIFHLHAARTALREGKASLFVYPLRALVSDQRFHLERSFATLGLAVAVVTGESSETARRAAYQALEAGEIDIVLTTPEYLYFHKHEFAATGRIAFVVVDEAHHIGQARSGNRPAYAQLGESIATLQGTGNAQGATGRAPTVLAVTATAGEEVAARIESVLGITRRVLDPTVRDNLQLVDRRKATGRTGLSKAEKQQYLVELVERVAGQEGGKIVVYVNSRRESVRLAGMLRRSLRDLAWQTAFYNAGMTREMRAEVERRFREGKLLVIIATSAFGEGVNISDIRDVVLYHFPFSDVEFNQMAGRCGRDGATARVHLLFGEADARINEFIVAPSAPPRVSLVALWRALVAADAQSAVSKGAENEEGFQATNASLADSANEILRREGVLEHTSDGSGGQDAHDRQHKGQGESDTDETPTRIVALNETGVSNGIGVFRELGFLRTNGRSQARRIMLTPKPAKMDLHQSVRYLEGLDEIEDFDRFKIWALTASAKDMLARFNRPILP
ncbi:MAG: single-stranded-DNA-specific exonuclease RecJ [Actinomycetes bacterium]|jgi:single-stranded-DNA-specific exonuclease|nr:single-stranded-DNA-specific exonuclease RecJ [Actinomycetes bacterium]